MTRRVSQTNLPQSSRPADLRPGDIEYELGVPLPGAIVQANQWTKTALKRLPQNGPLVLSEVFQTSAEADVPLVVELGCGNGRFTLSSAIRRPHALHLAFDLLPAVIRYATRRGNQRGLSNVRFAVSDGWRVVSQLLCENSVDEFHIYHPQPYADPSQQGQRMLTAQFLAGLHGRLRLGGRVYLQSDRQAYWNYIQQAFAAMFEWHPVLEPWPEDPNGRSRREILSVAQGLPIFRGFAVKITQLDAVSLQTIALSMPEPNFQMPKPIKRNRPWHRRGASARNRPHRR